MVYWLALTMGAVFLGTELISVSTPLAQLTPYRLLIFTLIPLIGYQLLNKDRRLVVQQNSAAGFAVKIYLIWYIYAIISGIWAVNKMAWLQAVFLLTLGIVIILASYFYINRLNDWFILARTCWIMMTGLLLWGYFEIITNIYLLADLSKLDKYGTFSGQFFSRIPVTIFENQNDYATMLLAYLALTIIFYQLANTIISKGIYLIIIPATFYLIYRTQSRMVLLSAIVFLFIYFAYHLVFYLSKKQWRGLLLFGVVALIALFILPPTRRLIFSVFYTGGQYDMSGDMVRMNLWRNGLFFLAATFGFGVGAGNIETWMEQFAILPTEVIVNMHNWWLEILTGYGLYIFMAYCLMYGILIFRLSQLRKVQTKIRREITIALLAFLWSFILASITSANNILIEWHWVFFALIIVYIKISEIEIYQENYKAKEKIDEHQYVTA